MTIFICNSCSRYPCPYVIDLDTEILKYKNTLNEDTAKILDKIAALSVPSADSILATMSTMIEDHPNDSVHTLEGMAKTLGLPYDNDAERMYSLGLVMLGGVAYVADSSNNVQNLRSLYFALGKNWELTKEVLDEKHGDYIAVYTKNTYRTLVSDKPLSIDQISKELGYTVGKQSVAQYGNTSVIHEEKYLGMNSPLSSFSESEINIKVFKFLASPSTQNIKRLNSYGLNKEQINQVQGIDRTISATKLEEARTLLSDVSDKNISTAQTSIKEYTPYYAFDVISLDKELLTTLSKSKDFEIESLLVDQPWVKGISLASYDDVQSKINEVNNVDAGTYSITNSMIALVPDSTVLAQLMLATYQASTLTSNSSTTDTINTLNGIILDINSGNTPTEPNFSYKSFDSGSSLINRNLDVDNTFNITARIGALGDGALPTLSTRALAEPLNATFQAFFGAFSAFRDKVNSALSDIEKMTSLGLSFSGAGIFESSFIKCATGVDFDMSYSPLADLINSSIKKFNDFLKEMSEVLQEMIDSLICKLQCLRDTTGVGGFSLDLPFCDLAVPPMVDLDPLLAAISQYATLFDSLMLKQIDNNNNLRLALTDMSRSFNNLAQGCSCSPLGGIFNVLRFAGV